MRLECGEQPVSCLNSAQMFAGSLLMSLFGRFLVVRRVSSSFSDECGERSEIEPTGPRLYPWQQPDG
jgi:hypothetical protein